MSKSDGGLWRWLQPAWRELGPRIQYQRIESSTSEGTPDLEVAGYGRQAWAELKAARLPASEDTPVRVKFRPGQVEFLEHRDRVSGRAFLVIRILPAKGNRALGHLVIPAHYVREVAEGLTLKSLDARSLISFSRVRPIDILSKLLGLPLWTLEGRAHR